MTFSEKLQTLRKQHHMSQEELAESCNVSRQAISKWEAGATMPELSKLIQISQLFQVSLDELLTDKPISSTVFDSYTYSFEKICNLLLPRRETMETLYDNALLYDTTYDEQMDNRVATYWREVFRDYPIKTIHDCSIGTGQLTLGLHQLDISLSGSDISQAMIEKCQQNASSKNIPISLKKCDFRELSKYYPKQQFDCVMSTGNSLPHVNQADVQKTLQEMNELVAPNGYLYLDIRNWDKILQKHQRFYVYQPFFNNGERINLSQIWDYNLDGTITFNLLYTFEKENKIYKKEVSSVYYYPIARSFLEQQLRSMEYTIVKEKPHFQQTSVEECDWYYILAKKNGTA